MNGVIVVDTPQDFTSFDVVAVMRGLSKEKKIGHTGTLDPMATGVLPLLLGRAAKALDLLPDGDKAYRAEFRLGERYDTGDVTGTLLETDGTPVDREALERAMAGFRGDYMQTPSMYSAVSVNGQRLYKLARKGIEVERPPRPVHIGELILESYDEFSRQGSLLVSCSKGTYIRVLIEDIAQAAGSLGVMTALRRTKACGFSIEEAVPLEDLRALASKEALEHRLRPIDSLFAAYPQVTVSGPQMIRFCNGGALDLKRLRLENEPSDGQRFRIYGSENVFLGLGTADLKSDSMKFLKLFAEEG